MLKNLSYIFFISLLTSCNSYKTYTVNNDLEFKRKFHIQKEKNKVYEEWWRTKKVYYLTNELCMDSNQLIIVANKIYNENLKSELKGKLATTKISVRDSIVYLSDKEKINEKYFKLIFDDKKCTLTFRRYLSVKF